ncbi:hypothetical protein FDUTEX481_08229 [Tolypothrix sp. PCC 7601]|nr:hypothetical protein FDUTEX481_08229 [Tolypothrix sp. PCC 7601]
MREMREMREMRGMRGMRGMREINNYCLLPNAQCPMPNAQCPMPNAQCPMPNAQCPMPHAPCPLLYILGLWENIFHRIAILTLLWCRGSRVFDANSRESNDQSSCRGDR